MAQPLRPFAPPLALENGLIPSTVLQSYESILYTFYSHDLTIDDSSATNALTHAGEIIEIGTYLGCMPVLRKQIDNTLIKHGQELYAAIQKIPHGWIDLAMKIHSEVIFKEAIVHLVGNWRRTKDEAVRDLEPKVRALCERLHATLVQRGVKLELDLASTYPGDMAKPSPDIPIKRDEYAKDVLVWMALTFFRHWLSQRLISGNYGHNAPDSGYSLYRELGQGGDAYMNKGVMNQFHNRFPMTKKAFNIMENHLLEIKECLKKKVLDCGILGNSALLDLSRFPVDYLTCVEVKKEDLPWYEKRREVSGGGAGNAYMATGKRFRPGGNEILQRNRAAMEGQGKGKERQEDADDEEEYDEEVLQSVEMAKRSRLA